MRPIYFVSRILLEVKKGYSEVEQAMMALIYVVRKFHSYYLYRPFCGAYN